MPLIQTMRTQTTQSSRIPLLLLGGLCAGLAIWATQLHSEVKDLSDENTVTQKKLESADRLLKTASAAAKKWSDLQVRQVQSSERAAAITLAPDSTEAAKAEHKRNVNAEEVASMVKNPAMRSLISSQQAAMIQMTYRDLLDQLKLSPDERDYMQKLLLERQMAAVNPGMQLMNPTLSSDERAALIQQIQDGVAASSAKIHDFLNDETDYTTFQNYSKQEPERTEVGMFESSLGGADALDPAKADALAGLLGDSRKNFPFTVDFYNHSNFGNPRVLNTATVNKFLDEQAQYQSQVAEKAADLLTPSQLEAFRQNQGTQRQMMKMQLTNIVQMAGGGQ